MTGQELLAHLREDGRPLTGAIAALTVVGTVLVISAVVHLWERHKDRQEARAREAARVIGALRREGYHLKLSLNRRRLIDALRREGYRLVGVDDAEWAEFTRAHGLCTPDLADDDTDGLTRDWSWP